VDALDESTGFVCPACRSDGNTVAAQVAGLPALEAAALGELEALDSPPTPEPPPGTHTTVLADGRPVGGPADISPLAESLRAALEGALAEGAVTVDIRIHTRPGKGN
jgi:hypothetical protein